MSFSHCLIQEFQKIIHIFYSYLFNHNVKFFFCFSLVVLLIVYIYILYSQMMIINRKISTQLTVANAYAFAGLSFGKKRDKPKNDSAKYDVVIVGGNLGALLSNHLDAVVGAKASIFVAYDNPFYQYPVVRSFYEKGLFTKFEMQATPKNSISKFAASSEGQGVTQFLPNENTVVLKNGRKVQYEQLVVATGLKQDASNIKGFEEAWADLHHPFYTSVDHPSWKTNAAKPYRFMHNFDGGQAIFYIPPYPFHTEIENYNFLLAKALWDRADKTGRITWANSRFTVINANDSFCHFYPRGDQFIREQCEKRNINIENGLKLVEVKKQTQTAVFQNVKTGESVERPYSSFYSLMEAKTDPILAEAGLADSTGQLDVDQHTLQHKKFQNVFGFGDVANVPTTKTFFAGFNQLHVVRHNLERQLNGLSPNAKYDGLSEAQMHVDLEKIVTFSHFYGGKPNDTLDDGFMASLRYKWAAKHKKDVVSLLKFKSWGPPYHKFKKTFSGAGDAPKTAIELHPEKKSA